MPVKHKKAPAKRAKKVAKKDLANVKQKAFLAAYSLCGNISAAARVAKIDRQCHYNWFAEDPDYAEKFAAAHEESIERLELEARRRAMKGVAEPVVYQGRLTYEPKLDEHGKVVKDEEGNVVFETTPLCIRKYSDTLLIFLLKGAKPDKYRDNAKIEHSGPGGGPIPFRSSVDLSRLTDEELEFVKRIAEAAAGSGGDRGGDPAPSAQQDPEVLPGDGAATP